MKKLSIIVLTYNQEKYVRRTLNSIISQKTNISFEVIVGDDASTDSTPKIIREYADRYPAIIKPVLRSQNIGLIRNYFSLLSMCTGEYIMECAGDDYWPENKIDFQIEYMEQHPLVDMVCGSVETIDQYENKLSYIDRKKEKIDFSELLLLNNICAVSVCFKRKCAEKYIEQIEPVQKGWKMEDYPMWLWIGKYGNIRWLSKLSGYYRILNGSVSHSENIKRQIEFEKAVYEIRVFYAESEKEKRKIESRHYANISYLYMNHGLISNYIKYTMKSKSMKYILRMPFRLIQIMMKNK